MMTPIGRRRTPARTSGRIVPRRGEVWLARLDKTRPVIILSRDPMGAYLNAVLAVPITRTIRNITTEVPVGPTDGVRYQSVANLDNLQPVYQDELLERVGRARPETLAAVCRALAFAVDCEST